jgi:hypothetical protein
MVSTSADDLRRAERQHRRRRVALGSSGFATVAIMATGVALAFPSQSDDSAAGGDRMVTAVLQSASEPASDDDVPFPDSRQLLVDTAIEHLDPPQAHLPNISTNALSTSYPGTALIWSNPGESGMGLVSTAVTAAGYANSQPDALERFAAKLGCDIGTESCTREPIPGTDRTAWVAAANPDHDFEFSVVYERADGSLVGLAVYDRISAVTGVIVVGPGSTGGESDPVSGVDVTLDDAFGFVTDPDLRLLPGDDG